MLLRRLGSFGLPFDSRAHREQGIRLDIRGHTIGCLVQLAMGRGELPRLGQAADHRHALVPLERDRAFVARMEPHGRVDVLLGMLGLILPQVIVAEPDDAPGNCWVSR